MNYLYKSIQPTRLYIKQCPHCGLKYFGKTTCQNIETYPGSGAKWTNHLNYHGVKPIHLWNSDWYHDTSISRFALKFSRLNKIVSSRQWANLKEEDGLDGGWDYINSNTDIRNKIHETKVIKYGDDYMMMLVSEDVTEKREATCIEKYGVKNTLLAQEIRDKQKKTLFQKYGVETPLESEEIRERGKNTMIERYGVENPGQIPEVKEKLKVLWEEKRANPEKYKKRYINDGNKTVKIHYKDPLPEGFFEGRLPNKKFSITNGTETTTISEGDEIPAGWYRGSSNKANKIVINNGIIEKECPRTKKYPRVFLKVGCLGNFTPTESLILD